MKILTKKKQSAVLARMVANAIIAIDALQYTTPHVYAEGRESIEYNLRTACYIIGGKDAVKDAYYGEYQKAVNKKQ